MGQKVVQQFNLGGNFLMEIPLNLFIFSMFLMEVKLRDFLASGEGPPCSLVVQVGCVPFHHAAVAYQQGPEMGRW